MACHIQYWPIFTFIWMAITVITSYSIAVYRGDVYYLFPFISDTACCTPESNIFAEMMNFGALFNFITIYIRFRQVQLSEHKGSDKIYTVLNNISFFAGLAICFGITVVANFPESSVKWVHGLGAAILFFGGIKYCFIQAYLTCMSFTSIFLQNTRMFLSYFLAVAYMADAICGNISHQQAVDDHIDTLHWNKNDPGYPLHLATTFLEWIVFGTIFLYLATFYAEFKDLEFDEHLALVKKSKEFYMRLKS